MSRSLTASDRASLIKLASSLPKGSPERKAILAGLVKTSSDELDLDLITGGDKEKHMSVAKAKPGTKIFERGREIGVACSGGFAYWSGSTIMVQQLWPRERLLSFSIADIRALSSLL